MNNTIKIGITYTGTDEKHINYADWLKGNDPIEIIALSPSHTDLKSIKEFDGIVLSGGIDMHPKYYESKVMDYPNAPSSYHEMRDEFEMEVFRLSQEYKIPVLGICRGMQLVNCLLGGDLIQDIGPSGNAIHRHELNDKAHGINIVPSTLLEEIVGQDRSVINSAHHQAIKTLGKGLEVNCTSDDNFIEGVEWSHPEDKPFFLGIQWHPERMYKLHLKESPLTRNIRDRFIEEIKNSTGKPL